MTVAIADFFNSLTHNDYLTLFLISVVPIAELRGAIVIMGGMVGINKFVGVLCCVAGSTTVILPLLLFIRPLIKKLKLSKRLSKLGQILEENIVDRAEPVLKRDELDSEMSVGYNETNRRNKSDEFSAQNTENLNGENCANGDFWVTDERNSQFAATSYGKKYKSTRNKLSPEIMTFLSLWVLVSLPIPFTGAWTGSTVGAFTKLKIWQAALAVFIGNVSAALILMLLCIIVPTAYIDFMLYGFLFLALAIGGILVYDHIKKKEKKNGLNFKTKEKACLNIKAQNNRKKLRKKEKPIRI